jgi:CheY-like chemotaxis protein
MATLLVIDDNPMVLDVVQGMLDAAGYHALRAADGATALDIFAHHVVHGAIIDVDMPGMNGVEVCRALQSQAAAAGRSLLAWMMTGVVRPQLVQAAEAAGAVGILPKPFTRAELLACFETLSVHLPEQVLT